MNEYIALSNYGTADQIDLYYNVLLHNLLLQLVTKSEI